MAFMVASKLKEQPYMIQTAVTGFLMKYAE
jgi:hypothetical protein